MKTTISILTQKKKASGHVKTEVIIDWADVTEDDLRILARNALIHDLQARFCKSLKPIPDKATVRAKDWIHEPSAALVKYQPPVRILDKELERLLKALTPEELRTLTES